MNVAGQRVIVTGGSGFIGSHLVQRLVREGAEVHVISRRAVRSDASALPAGVRIHVVDLTSTEALRPVVAAIQPSHVYHLAGRVDLERSLEVGQACVRDNIGATLSLLDVLRKIPPEALIYTSSTEVYGGNPIPFREEQPPDPPSTYAVSKLAGEHLCRIHAVTGGCRVAVLRLASGYGPGQNTARLVPGAVLSCLRGTSIRLRSPDHRRDFIYVADLVDGIVRAAVRPLAAFELINLGSQDSITVRELVSRVVSLADRPVAVEVAGESRSNEAPAWSTDSNRAERLLGWVPATSLEDGLQRTFRWYAECLTAATES